MSTSMGRYSRALLLLVSLLGWACGGGSPSSVQPAPLQRSVQGNLLLQGAELVQNGSFTEGLEGWETWLNVGADAVFKARGGRAVIHVRTPAPDGWGIQLLTHGQPLTAGRTYHFSFRARADVPTSIDVMVREHDSDVNGDGSAWSDYQRGTYTLGTEWTRYEVDFTMPFTDPSAGICFDAGRATSKVFIDDVSLVEIVEPPPGTELVENGDFGDRLKGWETWLQDGGVATFGMKKGAAVVTVSAPATTTWGIQLHRGGLPLFAGRLYRLSFTAWADAPVAIYAVVQENGRDVNGDGNLWSSYKGDTYNLGTAPQRFTARFAMPVTNADAGVFFFFGDASGRVFVDDVSVVEVEPPPPGSELIVNGTFDEGLSGWSTGTLNGAQAVFAAPGGEAVVDIPWAASSYSDLQLSNNGISLEGGKAYRLSFRARADQGGWLGTSIWENGNDTDGNGFAWSTYRFDWHELGPTMASYQVEFVMPVTNLGAGLCFFLGDLAGSVAIDDVSLVEIATPPPPPPPPPAGTELLTNGTFDAGFDGWRPFVGDTAEGTFAVEGGEAVITTITPGWLGDVQLMGATGVALYAGKTYRLRFDARSEAWASLVGIVYENGQDMDGDGDSYTVYGESWLGLTPDMTTYTIEFTMSATNPDARIALLVGDVAGQVVLDNVSLAEVVAPPPPPPTPGPELVWNGTFDAGLEGWSTYLMDGGAATFAVENGQAVVSIAAPSADYSGIQLSFNGLPLEAGRTYRVGFRARADGYRPLYTSIWENGNDTNGDGFGWSTYQFDYHDLTTEMSSYTVEFVMPSTNLDAGLCFFLGDAAGQVVIDDVSLVALQ